jgi:hypothetical protein
MVISPPYSVFGRDDGLSRKLYYTRKNLKKIVIMTKNSRRGVFLLGKSFLENYVVFCCGIFFLVGAGGV